jgi:citrate lyase subunit alpha / citrate CoA-transferase
MMPNSSVGRNIPLEATGGRPVFDGEFTRIPDKRKAAPKLRRGVPGVSKVLPDLEAAIRESGLKDGMTVSFHHHLRDGDGVVNMVMETCARMGMRDLTIAPTSVFGVHEPLLPLITSGVITGIQANFMTGPVGQAVAAGAMPRPVILRTHGGRVRAIESGELHIDVAFMGAPTADAMGNMTGVYGPSACGSLGYAVADSSYADYVVAITDNLVSNPIPRISVPGSLVDAVVKVDRIGDPRGIVSGSTRMPRDPIGLLMAGQAARVIEAAGYLKDGFSFQTGAGGPTLATAEYIKRRMKQLDVKGSFALGGIMQQFCEMLNDGLFTTLLDTQDFDMFAIQSLRDNRNHQEIDCGHYANPWNPGAIVNYLDVVVLGATEVDTDFNVNVTTSSDGIIMGGSGGHSDASAGARLSVIVTSSTRTRLPIVRDRVTTVTTPGESVDVVVTERGIAVNPRRSGLAETLSSAGLPVRDIHDIEREVAALTGTPEPVNVRERVVAINEYRDGSVIDVVHQVV